MSQRYMELEFMTKRSKAVRCYILNIDPEHESISLEIAMELFRQECPGVTYSHVIDVGIQDPEQPIEIDDSSDDDFGDNSETSQGSLNFSLNDDDMESEIIDKEEECIEFVCGNESKCWCCRIREDNTEHPPVE